MDGLPLLPGYTFRDINVTKFHLQQKFDFKNGYRMPRTEWAGIGMRPKDADSIAYYSAIEPVKFDPSLTYGRVKNHVPSQVVPHWVTYDKKALTFKAFFKQSVFESPNEHYRIRHVNIIYFLEDDTITVMEPPVENSGFAQGRIVKRGPIPKHVIGTTWHWKDLNVGVDVAFYGIVYHTVDCDTFTREFMESQGIELNPTEDLPPDPYTMERRLRIKPCMTKTPMVDDKLRRFLEYDGKILRFWGVWDNRDAEYGELQNYVIYYYLADDCVEVQEIHGKNDGRDPFPLLMKRAKLPRNWKDLPVDFPVCYMERSDAEVSAYYTPLDFVVGNTIFVLGRRFLIYDCDPFTRNYYKTVQNIIQGEPIEVFEKKPQPPERSWPPHTGIGKPEDSIQNCYTLHPKAPRLDFVRYCFNANKYLRYEAEFEAVHPEDVGRKFVFMYHLADGSIRVVEPPVDNSGFVSGTFLKAMCVPKPGSNPDNPDFYTPADLYIGAMVNVWGQRFVITDADLRVYRYMEDNPTKFTPESIVIMRNHFAKKGLLDEDIKERTCELHEMHLKDQEPDCDNLPEKKKPLQL